MARSGDDESVVIEALKPGFALDRYELLCEIASGGMATVWLARMRGKRGFEKLFAVKTIKSELSDDPHFEEMFLDEARIASNIQHPNVAQIIDLGEKDGVLYIVMEWVDGESLAKVRRFAGKKGVRVPLGIALRVLADACAGLHAAHELEGAEGQNLGIVHRDVSPQNILIAASGAVKVIDFGVAKAENRLAPKTHSGIIKGKLQYMAPEQALGRSYDRRVDVWAIGACLYELLHDRLPVEAEGQLELLRKLTEGVKPRPIDKDLPAAVAGVLMRALSPDPGARYPTCAALRGDLQSAMKELALPSSPEDVVAFLKSALPERAKTRNQMVTDALRTAATRDTEGVVGAFDSTVVAMGDATPSRAATRREGRAANADGSHATLESAAVGGTRFTVAPRASGRLALVFGGLLIIGGVLWGVVARTPAARPLGTAPMTGASTSATPPTATSVTGSVTDASVREDPLTMDAQDVSAVDDASTRAHAASAADDVSTRRDAAVRRRTVWDRARHEPAASDPLPEEPQPDEDNPY